MLNANALDCTSDCIRECNENFCNNTRLVCVTGITR